MIITNPELKKQVEERSLLPTNDVIFHILFGKVGNENITRKFIENTLNTEVGEIELDKNLNLQQEHYDDKLGVLDVRAKTKDGINYNIEMQNTSSDILPERILSYWSRLYTGDLKRGNDYDTLAKTVAILIVNDDIVKFDLINKYTTRWNIREEEYNDIILTDDLDIRIIELPKYKKLVSNGSVEKNIWLEFLLKPNGKEVLTAMKDDAKIREAHDEWKKIIEDEKARDRALRLEIAELDRNTAIKHARRDGIKEGMEAGIEKIIQSMFEQNVPLEDIAKYTQLSLEEVQNIINKNKK